jgi:hypothetical protein
LLEIRPDFAKDIIEKHGKFLNVYGFDKLNSREIIKYAYQPFNFADLNLNYLL